MKSKHSSSDDISILTKKYVFGTGKRDEILPLILPYGQEALNCLLSDLCAKATDIKNEFLPGNAVHDKMKESGKKERNQSRANRPER